MATPHVAGGIALLWSAVPTLTNNITATENYLNDTAFHIGSSACSSSGWPNNLFGYGRLDVLAAVKTALIDFKAPPVSEFVFSRPAYLEQTVVFTNLSRGLLPITSTWDFGDGTGQISAGTTLNPVQYTYTSTGSHIVTLTASNTLGQSTFKDTLTVYQASVTLKPITATRTGPFNIPLTYTLHLTNTGDLTDSFLLEFGGPADPGWYANVSLSLTQTTLPQLAGTPVMVEVPFPYFGTLPLHLPVIITATSLNVPGQFATATVTSLFTPMPDEIPPTPAFTYTKPVYINQSVTLTNLSTGTLPLTSTWNFGDNHTNTITGTAFLPVHHIYTRTGVYTVTLRVSNIFGQDSITRMVTVHPVSQQIPPTAAFTFTTPVYLNQATTFTNLTGGTLPITSTWDFGEGTPPENKGTSLMPVEHTYTTAGTYTVILTASNAFGEDVFSDTLSVRFIQVYLPIVLK